MISRGIVLIVYSVKMPASTVFDDTIVASNHIRINLKLYLETTSIYSFAACVLDMFLLLSPCIYEIDAVLPHF